MKTQKFIAKIFSDRKNVVIIFIVTSGLLLLPHLLGIGVFIGDSDRMNHSLSLFKLYLNFFKSGQFPLWDESIFGGLSLVSIPYQFPNPIVWMAAIFNLHDVYKFAGFEAFFLFILAAWFAFEFLMASGRSYFSSVVGAIMYQTCALSLLKNAQNDMSFMVIILIPLMLLCIKNLNNNTSLKNYVALSAVFLILFNFTFLQKVGYAIILGVAYAVWLVAKKRNWKFLILYVLSLSAGLVFSLPRIITIAADFSTSNRISKSGFKISRFWNGEHLPWYELLRWFDARIFGSSMAESQLLGGGINLSEGFLLYMGVGSALITLFVIVSRLPWKVKEDDAKFCVYVVVASFLVVFTSFGYNFVYELFGRVGFIHYRILIVAILPICLLNSLFLDYLILGKGITTSRTLPFGASGIVNTIGVSFLALINVVTIELIAQIGLGGGLPSIGVSLPIKIQGASAFRICAYSFVFLAIYMISKKKGINAHLLQQLFGLLLIFQTLTFGIFFIWGPDRWSSETAFKTTTNAFANKGEFLPPSEDLNLAIKNTFDPESYRTSIICTKGLVGIICPTRISVNYGLRTMDGYISSVPERIVELNLIPTEQGRSVTYSSLNEINWALLGLFNTKYVLEYNVGLLSNAIRSDIGSFREININDFIIHKNPFPVAERVFFAEEIKVVKNIKEAKTFLQSPLMIGKQGYFPQKLSVVEGGVGRNKFLEGGLITADFNGSNLVISFPPSKVERFIVINERFDESWIAKDNLHNEVKIYPTNIFMRGLKINPGISSVSLSYRPFLVRPQALICYLIGISIFLVGLIFIKNKSRTRCH